MIPVIEPVIVDDAGTLTDNPLSAQFVPSSLTLMPYTGETVAPAPDKTSKLAVMQPSMFKVADAEFRVVEVIDLSISDRIIGAGVAS